MEMPLRGNPRSMSTHLRLQQSFRRHGTTPVTAVGLPELSGNGVDPNWQVGATQMAAGDAIHICWSFELRGSKQTHLGYTYLSARRVTPGSHKKNHAVPAQGKRPVTDRHRPSCINPLENSTNSGRAQRALTAWVQPQWTRSWRRGL